MREPENSLSGEDSRVLGSDGGLNKDDIEENRPLPHDPALLGGD